MNIGETRKLLCVTLEAALKLHRRAVVSICRPRIDGYTELTIETWDPKGQPGLSRNTIACRLLNAAPYAGTSLWRGAGQYDVRLECEPPSTFTAGRAVRGLADEIGGRLFGEVRGLSISTHTNDENSGIEVSI